MSEPHESDGSAGGEAEPDLARLVASAAPVLRRAAPRLMSNVLRRRYRTSDLVQSALVEAIASMPAFRGTRESEFVGWTLRILERNALDRQRRLLARKRCVDREVGEGEGTVQLRELALDTASPSELAIDREQLIRIARAMRRLPTDQRRILQLIALRGASHAEAAELIGRSEGACRVLLARARAALVVALAREAGR